MEFAAWKEWTPPEVAFFISTFCNLPQYATAIGQNISGQALQRLSAANMLTKGLARAGVCDWSHQRLIASAVEKLETHSSEQLSEELNMRLQENVKWRSRHRRPAPPKTARGMQRPRRRQIEVHLRLHDPEAMHSARSSSPTCAGMQRPSTADPIVAATRSTSRPWHHDADEFSRRDIEDENIEHARSSSVAGFSRRLREQLATNVREYEIMGQHADPLYATVSPRMPRAKEIGCRPQTCPVPLKRSPEKMVDSATSAGNRTLASTSASQAEDRKQPRTNELVSKATSLTGAAGAEEKYRSEFAPCTIGASSTNRDRNKMMQGLLGKEDLAVGTGLQAVQKIQAQRHHEKESTTVHECGGGTLETLTNVLHSSGGSGHGVETQLEPHAQSLNNEKKPSEPPVLSSPDQVTARAPNSAQDEEYKAAVKVQSCHRKRQAMREAELRRHNKKATEINHFHEYHTAEHAQQQLQRKKEDAEKKDFDESLKAATKIQAIHRGNQARSAYYEKHDKHRSSVDNNDGHKGQTSASKKTMSADAAATSIQATFRGNRDRNSSLNSN